MNFEQIVAFVFRWQEFLGALIGASTPIFFWFFVRWVEKINNRKDTFLYLQKNVVYNINTLIDVHNTLRKFFNVQFRQLLDNIQERTKLQKYSADRAYLPLFVSGLIDDGLISKHSGSGYVDNKILLIHKLTKEFSVGIEDISKQFADTVNLNMNMAFSKVNPPLAQNESFKNNLIEFEKAVERDIFDQNIPVSMKVLAETLVALECINKKGLFVWKHVLFSGAFKFFKTRKDFKEFQNKTHERIEEYLKESVNKKLEDIKTKLDKKVIRP
ncbi:MAG: hypothetical protein RLY49_74 [Candidatus Parcubacteria bacterium]|jgi:hypothetical protein